MNAIDFLVRKDQFTITELRETPAPALEDGQVRLGVDKFALTANNITYAAFGEAMSYWNFYPAADGWGRIPVWGFGTVLESRAPGVAIGEKFYGYYPMSCCSRCALQQRDSSTAPSIARHCIRCTTAMRVAVWTPSTRRRRKTSRRCCAPCS